MSAAMPRALQLVAVLSPLLFGSPPTTAAGDICNSLDDGRQAFTARDICEVYEKPGTYTWGNLFTRALGRTEFRRSHALVIGVGDYDHWRNLEAPLGDAKRVRDFLINEAEFDLVVTLTNARATKRRIEGLMEEFFPNRTGEYDRFLFYFSGHGTQRSLGGRNRGYLVLQPAHEEGWAAMLGMNDVEDWAENLSTARQSLFVLDACFSGLAGTQVKGLLGDEKTIERLSQYGHHLITAGTEDEQSIAVGGASLFTNAFLRAASGWGDSNTADQPADGVVSLKELTEYISRYLDAKLARLGDRYKMTPQTSELQDESAGEFFFLVKSPTESPLSGPATTDAALDAKGPAPSFEMVRYDEGRFWRGASLDDLERVQENLRAQTLGRSPLDFTVSTPAHLVLLSRFEMDVHEVTWGQFHAFLETSGRSEPMPKHILKYVTSNDQPVFGVTWAEADAYCRAQGKRLPTEAEWERAARGQSGRLYPWGDDLEGFEDVWCSACSPDGTDHSGPSAVGSSRRDRTPEGVADLAGNVREWVSDWYSSDFYQAPILRDPENIEPGEYRVVRGGSWYDPVHFLPAFHRGGEAPDRRDPRIGFRCARSFGAG